MDDKDIDGSKPVRTFRPLADEVALLEKKRMTQALELCGWVQVHAARLLRVPRRTFLTKMKRYGIRPPMGHCDE